MIYYCESCGEQFRENHDRCPYCNSIDVVSWAVRYDEQFYDDNLENLEEENE